MNDRRGSTRTSTSQVSKVSKPPVGSSREGPPLPSKRRAHHIPEASFSNVYGANANDLRTADGINLKQQSHPTVFSPSRNAVLNLASTSDNFGVESSDQENQMDSLQASRLPKIYFGSENSTGNRQSHGNVQNRISEFQSNQQIIREKFLGNRETSPEVRNPTLGELLSSQITAHAEATNPMGRGQQTLLRHKVAKNPNSINFSGKMNAAQTGGQSIDVDSLQDPESSHQSSLKHSTPPVGNTLRRNRIQDMPLPEIPVKSGSKTSNRTLINLRNKQPVKEAVRNIENNSRSGTPNKEQKSKFDISHDPEPNSEFFHEPCQHQKLIKNDPAPSHNKVDPRQRKRQAPSKENCGKHRKRPVKGMTSLFLMAVLFSFILSENVC